MKIWCVSDRGAVRAQNQDTFYQYTDGKTGFVMVCDGMGGAQAGNVASALAVRTFVDVVRTMKTPPEERLNAALKAANESVYLKAREDAACRGMGTTLVAALVHEDMAYVLNVGDSRAYYVTEHGIHQVTRDHSLVNDMVEHGQLTAQEARNHPRKNVITRALGVDRNVAGDLFFQVMEPGSYLLLCSDGLSNLMEDQELLYEVIHGGEIEQCCERLLSIAMERGAPDNVTAVLLAVGPTGQQEER